jgi:hypothetical protein
MKDLDWIAKPLVGLHSYCERAGLAALPDRLAEGIEVAAPVIRGDWVDLDAEQAKATASHIARLAMAGDCPLRPMDGGRLRLVSDVTTGVPT